MGASEKPSATSKMILPYCEALTPFSIDIHTWQCWCMMWCTYMYILRICIVKWAGHFTFSSVESAYSLSLFGQGNGILFRDIVSLSSWPLGHPSRRAEDWLPLKKDLGFGVESSLMNSFLNKFVLIQDNWFCLWIFRQLQS